MLPKKNRLDLSQNKKEKRQIGRKAANEELGLTFRDTGTLKAAIIVSKKVVPLAVDRNRIKRLLSESIRKQGIVQGDLLIVVRKNISKLGQKSVGEKLERLLLELKNV